MDVLLNPNVAYLIFAGGMMVAILAVISPGTGLLEIAAGFAFLLAGWAVYNLPVNGWALVILAIGVFPFLIAVRRSGRLIYLGISIAALVIGSAYLFRGETWWQPAVHPLLALVVSVLLTGFFWIAVRKYLEAVIARPAHDLRSLIGAIGEAKTDIQDEGSVQVGGELWSARSDRLIIHGERVRVIAREGFLLTVEPVS